MSIEVNLKVREYDQGEELPAIVSDFVRHSFTSHYKIPALSLTSGSKTAISTNLTSIEFIYVNVTGDATDVTIFRGNSPEGWEFSDTFMVFEAEGITSVSLQSDADTTVSIFLGGS